MKDGIVFGIVGLGLMGGGFARGFRCSVPGCKILACDANNGVLEAAVAEKVIDAGYALKDASTMLSECDVVFVCVYPEAAFDFIKFHAADFKKTAVVTDIAGVKGKQAALCAKICPQYIAGHPMAGSDREGFSHSATVHFEGRNYILMPPERTGSAADSETDARLELLKEVISSLGFSQIIETTPEIHDHKIAFTSQLCHVIASALVDCAEDERVTEFGGGSFEDLTRIAMINAPLWTELFLSNKDSLLPHIDSFLDSMLTLRSCIADDDAVSLEKFLSNVREKRSAMRRTESTREK